jgi:16S rRNA (cytosine967-C5)-methyltransferase
VQDAAAQRAAPLLLAGLLPAVRRPPPCACSMPARRRAARPRTCSKRPDADRRGAGCRSRCAAAASRDTLGRLGLQAKVVAADAADVRAWWDGEPFDAVLLDAPCTASGIVRRHPDVRWLRRPGDLPNLAAQQQRLLRHCGRW